MHIYVIHENAAWLEPLARALDAEKVPWRDWFLDQGMFDLSKPPPAGVFYNRMSASSHTRDHRYAAELTAAVLAWLAGHGRRVVNGHHEVFDYRNMLVCDGAAVPANPGVNPSLTITAMAEAAMAHVPPKPTLTLAPL